jgi:hypothetical protein
MSETTKPKNPVELLACAIATQEGFFLPEVTIPKMRNNPGDLDYAGQIGASRPRMSSPDIYIAVFASLPLGVAALFRQLWLQIAQGQTVTQIINQWSDNDPVYLANVLAWTGLPPDTPVLELLPTLVELNEAR